MTREQKAELAKLLPEGRVRFDEPMGLHSSMGVGGPVEAFATVEDIAELKSVVAWAMERTIDYRVWGGGSNTLVRDGGLRGVAIQLGKGFDALAVDRTDNDVVYVQAGAATPTQKFVRWCADEGLAGIELLAGCWGTVGGNLLTNAGGDGGAIGDLVEEITVVDREGRELTMKKTALRFEYRSLKIPRTMTVVRALLKLTRSEPSAVQQAIEKKLESRGERQPMEAKSLGCVFKNPEKTPAGVLIEEAGLKGVRIGRARVSAMHANFIINEGKAAARDIIVLMNLIRERVKEQTGIVLESEIEIVGDE